VRLAFPPSAHALDKTKEHRVSDAYDDDMAAEQAIFDQIARAEPREEEQPQKLHSKGGRPSKVDPVKLVAWRQGRKATIAATAKHWNVSEATVKRLSREYAQAAEAERQRFQMERVDKELEAHEYGLRMMYLRQRSEHLSWVSFRWFGAEEAAKGTPKEDAVMAAKEAALDEADRQFREEWEQRMGPVPGLSDSRD
jgi:hypothetical protein